MTVRVLVNLLWMVPGVVGGSEDSTTDALRAVADATDGGGAPGDGTGDGPDLEVTLAVGRTFAGAHPDLADRFRCEVHDDDGTSKARRVLAEQTWLADRARALGSDVVHHAGGIVPLRHPGRVVLTVHDLQPLDLPANFAPAKRWYVRAMAGRSVAAADVVCVPSDFTRDRVVALLGADPGRVHVVPWSVRTPPARAVGPGGGPAALEGLDGPYLLYPAITYPHKGHLALLEAFARVAAADPDVRLVLTGGAGRCEDDVLRRAARSDLRGRVLRPGRVPAGVLESLYRGAAAVCVPSRYEGFGLPVLEAMARGVPVLAAAAGSLPEVARPEDLLPVDDVAAWSAAMHAVLTAPPAERSARVAAGLERAATFTPGRTAAALLAAYRAAAVPSPHRPRST